MGKLSTAFNLLRKDYRQFLSMLFQNFCTWLPDEFYLRVLYRLKNGIKLNLKCPQSFTEKIQWLKLYDRKSEYTDMVDKSTVKKYVSDKIGERYIIPTIGVWDSFDDIDFMSFPNQFVLKTTHGGGSYGVYICKDKTKFDKKEAKRSLERSFSGDLYKRLKEWPYKNVPKRIIAEKYMCYMETDVNAELSDYKFFCFNGEPKYCQVIRNRRSHETIDFYDMEWNHQEFVGLNPVCRNGETPVCRPDCLEEMIEICKKLADNIPFLRVDLYEIDGNVYFGELTFFPASGFGTFSPTEWNVKLGNLIELN